MKPKKEARRLVDTFYLIDIPIKYAKQCALKCVDELQKSHLERFYDYYEEVKQEIKLLKK